MNLVVANTGKLLFVKLLHFQQKSVVLLLFVVFPSSALLSLSPDFPLLDSGPIGEGNPVQLRHPPPTVGKLTGR